MTERALPLPGEILWCAFPYSQEIAPGVAVTPGPKSRPVLVVASGTACIGDAPHVDVAYGTTVRPASMRHVLAIDAASVHEFRAAGLVETTYFHLQSIARLAFNRDFFPAVPAMRGRPPQGDCVLGALHPRSVKKFADVVLDIAAHRGIRGTPAEVATQVLLPAPHIDVKRAGWRRR